MTWRRVTEPPSQPDRYPIRVETGTLLVGHYSPARGWTDGLTKLNHVRWWFELPPVPQKTRAEGAMP